MKVSHRYLAHAVVLLVAVALSGYASVGRGLPGTLRLGATSAEAMVLGEGGSVGGVMLGRLSTIIPPLGVPTGPDASHLPFPYTVQAGDTMNLISARYHFSVEQLRWSNPSLFAIAQPAAGSTLWLPPGPGVVITVRPGDTVLDISRAFHQDPVYIQDFNYIRDPMHLQAGAHIFIPGATHPDLTLSVVTDMNSSSIGNHFPYGQCTWYVASRRPIPWNGNAGDWFAAAQALAWPTGQTPQVGSIMVTWESWYGHVGYVEQVNPDGSWVVAEMNYKGFAIVDHRTIKPGAVPLVGFIY